MIEVTATTKTKKNQKLIIPNRWDELTLDQWVQIELLEGDDFNPLKVFSILSGIDFVTLENSKDKRLEEAIFKCVSFIQYPPKIDEKKYSPILELETEILETPKKIDDIMLGQKMLIMGSIKETRDLIKNIPRILAIIFLPQMNNGVFESKMIDDLSERMKTTNGLQAYSIARGFFLTYEILSKVGLSDLDQYLNQPKKVKKLYQNWLTKND